VVTTAPGTRVVAFALTPADADAIYIYGLGTYVGDFPRPGSDRPATRDEASRYAEVIRSTDASPIDPRPFYDRQVELGKMTKEDAEAELAEGARRAAARLAQPMAERVEDLHRRLSLNPKIELDDGAVVWGCQCWWGPGDENDLETKAAGRRIVTVPVPVW
jgi:hypothetical protein